MQTAIAVGTLLQKHYKVVKLLGQGGFGRTYLAEDEGRFNERCVIKEFVPIKEQDHFSDKATQLFQREASVLYQITHPQIPQFRATFEEQERLFLVQDYVEGLTYHEILNQRKLQDQSFSAAEVKQFIQQMLPVLAHIHDKGIIHRDISPDNIIQRVSDRLPVLIDFGVVKEVVTRLQMSPSEATGNLSQATTVGKAGYAPSEQIQTGRAYPCSDLYALAVTAIVLLTGREPQSLFDDINLVWNWQSLVTVTPGFAEVLNKALQYRPSDRYQSVSQMAQALQSIDTLSSPPTPHPPSPPPLSQIKTVAVGRPLPATDTETTTANQSQPRQITPRPLTNQSDHRLQMPFERERPPSFFENPVAVGTLAAGLVTAAGFGGWATVRYLNSPTTPEPTIPSIPLESEVPPTPTAEPQPAEPQPAEYNQPLSLTPDVTETIEGDLLGGDRLNYLLFAEPGQQLTVAVAPEGVLLSVLGPDNRPVDRDARRVAQWQGTLSESGEYKIQISPVQGVPDSDFQLSATLSDLPVSPPETEIPETELPTEPPTDPPVEPTAPPTDGTDPLPTERPTEPPPTEPNIQRQRVTFPSGSQRLQLEDSVGADQLKRYVVSANQGQILTVNTLSSSGPVSFELLMPDGTVLPDASNLERWQGFLPEDGNYSVDVTAAEPSEFTLEIQLSAEIPSG
ncbi:protein kinase domain [Synechococcus sp. PCC 7335]|uniref:serine/threonine-protein kinase n=1 Tax=Synechococcus sp. (strain ATCC 29403 / PCC 7335) TaxID=91464 RepID=UPI00017EB844|nr:serine/threonine-protein kinase [Synechococcus sp. PCC 7335]EDX84409.1 protein kinase domain [Synechococcus sp. PCC 7335]